MFAATLRRSFNMSSTVTSAPFSRAVVNSMRKLYDLAYHNHLYFVLTCCY